MWYTNQGTGVIIGGTEHMERLARWLRDEVERTSVRDVERRTGVAKSSIARIASGAQATPPDLETLVRLAAGLNQPLIDLVEWVGYDPGLPDEDDALVRRLQAEAQSDPQLAEILGLLRRASDQDRRAVLTYLRGALGSGQ